MSKYIIDTDDLEINPVKILIIGEGTYKEKYVDDLEELCDDYIRKEYRELPTEAYKRGYDYGLLKGKHDAEQDMYDKGYQKGFEEGKGAINKGCEGCRYSGTPQGDSPCFSCANYYPNNWEAKRKDKILIGDVVKFHENGDNFIVTALNIDDDDDMCVLMTRNGGFLRAYTDALHKTGKHVDLVGMLKEMDE